MFCSKIRGDNQEDADIDVLVILSHEDRDLRREILKAAARFSLEHDVLLGPRIIGAERRQKMRGFSLYKIIRQEAARLDVVRGKLALEPITDVFY